MVDYQNADSLGNNDKTQCLKAIMEDCMFAQKIDSEDRLRETHLTELKTGTEC